MNILFLDVDGVLNSRRTAATYGKYPWKLDDKEFDGVALEFIKKACYELDLKVVISSTWRNVNTVDEFAGAFGVNVIGKTPSFPNQVRGREIEWWLLNNSRVMKYAIIDDDDDFLEEQMEFLVRTSNDDGLLFSNMERLYKIFGATL